MLWKGSFEPFELHLVTGLEQSDTGFSYSSTHIFACKITHFVLEMCDRQHD